ncbi:hypothetical protein AAFF_G00028950 [Aldrovandia affinis]|uniref:Uncharacterized protein n=1 Tax=Aldrovandia affinis TaxID=143900 RepID=A0AAD7S4I2_9TELE|nr:hypothetical protein AAFF_G00028950 [Aldrovandia affinis]
MIKDIPQEKQWTQNALSSANSSTLRKKPCKRRPTHKVAPPVAPSKRAPHTATTLSGRRERTSFCSLPFQPGLATLADVPLLHCGLIREPPSTEAEVQLAENYDVYIPMSQLDSILVNHTRSGSRRGDWMTGGRAWIRTLWER